MATLPHRRGGRHRGGGGGNGGSTTKSTACRRGPPRRVLSVGLAHPRVQQGKTREGDTAHPCRSVAPCCSSSSSSSGRSTRGGSTASPQAVGCRSASEPLVSAGRRKKRRGGGGETWAPPSPFQREGFSPALLFFLCRTGSGRRRRRGHSEAARCRLPWPSLLGGGGGGVLALDRGGGVTLQGRGAKQPRRRGPHMVTGQRVLVQDMSDGSGTGGGGGVGSVARDVRLCERWATRPATATPFYHLNARSRGRRARHPPSCLSPPPASGDWGGARQAHTHTPNGAEAPPGRGGRASIGTGGGGGARGTL